MKKLKVGFAMGGGVSLGTFSGMALSEAIKQLVLYGGYESDGKFEPYDHIEIDLFLGASAGDMSLAIMLRGLAYQTQEERDKATVRLKQDLGEAYFNGLPAIKQKQLVAAQVVQDLQHGIWIDQINIERLLGYFEKDIQDLTYEPGVLSRRSLEKIARDNFNLDWDHLNDFSDRQLLAGRVLFGAALANLTPIQYDARKGGAANPNFPGLSDALTSYGHRELRIFDLYFDKQLEADSITRDPGTYPSRWIRYHLGEKKDGFFGDLRERRSWAKMVSTAISCGSFPFAFGPVVLRRHAFEYGQQRDPNTDAILENGNWPDELKALKDYPFSYIDGGTFNNEPVREAYRLAAFQDAGEKEEFDRVIIFVDPDIASGTVNYRVPIHKEYYLRGEPKLFPDLVGFNMMRSTTLDRFLPHVFTMLAAIMNEARVNESDNIHRAYQVFGDSEKYQALLLALFDKCTIDDDFLRLAKDHVVEVLKAECIDEMLPAGALTLTEELLRIKRLHQFPLGDDIIAALVNNQYPGLSSDNKNLLGRALLMLLVDLMMSLTGKIKDSKTVGIAPVERTALGNLVPQFLPGGYIEAFAGFTSKVPNLYEAELARYCAQVMLQMNKLLPPVVAHPYTFRKWTTQQQDSYTADFRQKLPLIEARVKALLTDSRILNIGPLIDRKVLSMISDRINQALEVMKLQQKTSIRFLFRIPVDSDRYQIDGKGQHQDISTIHIDGRPVLMTELNFESIDGLPGKWVGEHVQENNKLLIDRYVIIPTIDIRHCSITLPDEQLISRAMIQPNPVFVFTQTITGDSQDKDYSENFWEVDPGVTPLEDKLLD